MMTKKERALEAAGRAAEKELNAADRNLRPGPVAEVYAGIGRAAIKAYKAALSASAKTKES